jgi:predicted lactoylglutathione lyase
MVQMIFVNLPVGDLSRSRGFYEALGFRINEQFSDDTGACVVMSDAIYVMLLTHPKYAQFTALPITDERKSSSHILALSQPGRDGVDAFAAAALKAGGAEPRPAQDLGFMYSRAIADPDGHVWEPFWMDPAAVQGGAD